MLTLAFLLTAQGLQLTGSKRMTDPQPDIELMGKSGPHFSDIRQGKIGDCYFLAALAATATVRPGLIEKLFVGEGERSDSGRLVYQLRFNLDGRDVEVAVDDTVPLLRYSRTFIAASVPTKKFWPAIVEKAFAKLFGTYGHIEGGFANEAFKVISQARSRRILVGSIGELAWLGRDRLWGFMKKAHRSSWPMVAGSRLRHAYAVLELGRKTVKQKSVRAIRLFNPNGVNRYTGAIEGQSKDRGDYWVTFDEFSRDFKSLRFAEMEDDARVVSRSVAPGLALFSVTTQSARPFSVHLDWPSDRLASKACRDEVTARMAVVPVKHLHMAMAKRATRAELTTFREVTVSEGPGEYLVFVGAGFGRLSPVLEEVTLAVHAHEEDQITLTQVNTSSFTSKCIKVLGVKCSWLLRAARQRKQETTTAAPIKESVPPLGRCARQAKSALDRLKHLNNVEELRRGANDTAFPPEWASIGLGVGWWEEYLVWRSLSNVLGETA